MRGHQPALTTNYHKSLERSACLQADARRTRIHAKQARERAQSGRQRSVEVRLYAQCLAIWCQKLARVPHDAYWQKRGIVLADGGQVGLEGTPGKGSRFSFTIPTI